MTAITPEIAHENFIKTVEAKGNIATGFLTLGGLLKENLDNGLWKILGHDSFEAYVATPEIALSRSYSYQVVNLYRVYVEKLGLDMETLRGIGPSRLIKLLPLASDGKIDQELLDKAGELSISDLDLEVRGAGKIRKRDERMKPDSKTYPDYLNEEGCCVCGEMNVERSHYPRTKGAGAGESEWVPMCRSCHTELHHYGVDTFTAKYKAKIWAWVYGRMMRLWENRK
jgi:hypothetical protein